MSVAVILAGGRGSRLAPLSDYLPKSMFPIHGVAIIETLIKGFVSNNIIDILLILREKGKIIEDFITKNHNFGAKIQYIHEDPFDAKRGMGVALLKSKERVYNLRSNEIIVSAGDTVYPFEYIAEIIQYHQDFKCQATLSVCNLDDPTILPLKSCVGFTPNGDIFRIIEKPRSEEILSTFTSVPLYVFEPKIFQYLERLTPSIRGEYELQSAIQMMIDDKCVVKGFPISGWHALENWLTLDTNIDLMRLNFPYLRDFLPIHEKSEKN